MNSISGVLGRIQEILTRIQEIRATDGRVQGYGPSSVPASSPPRGPAAPATPTASTGVSMPAAPTASGAPSLSPAKAKEFQQLLQQSLATQSNGLGIGSPSGSGGLPSGNLSGLGGLSNLESILGTTAGSGGTLGATNNNALQQYQKQLIQALQQLAAQKKQGSM